MKNLFLTVMMIATFLASTGIVAQTTSNKTDDSSMTKQNMNQNKQQTPGFNFIDSDGNGVCDNRTGRRGNNRNFVDGDGNGVCDNVNARGNNNRGRNFIDKNNDDICDNFKNGRQGYGFRKGKGQCRGNGKGSKNRRGQR